MKKAIKWHLGLIKYPNKRWAWSEDPLKKQAKIKKLVTYKTFQAMLKHFAVVRKDRLPRKGTPHYFRILLLVLKYWKKILPLYGNLEACFALTKEELKAKARRTPKNKESWKTDQNGVDSILCKIRERDQFGCYVITDHLAKVGRKTYSSTSRGKSHYTVDQLLDPHKRKDKLLVIDNGFPAIQLLENAEQMRNTKVVATQRGKTVHLPARHQMFLKQTKILLEVSQNSCITTSSPLPTGMTAMPFVSRTMIQIQVVIPGGPLQWKLEMVKKLLFIIRR